MPLLFNELALASWPVKLSRGIMNHDRGPWLRWGIVAFPIASFDNL
jgi:hypothetical protein